MAFADAFVRGGGTIRRCKPDDGVALAAIYDPIVARSVISFEELPPGPDEMRRRIAKAGDVFPWLAFERQGDVLGYVCASQHRTRAAYRWAVDVSAYVDPAARRRGIGRALYTRLFDVLSKQGYAVALAGIALPNEASVDLHRDVGFTEVGTYHAVGFKFGRWHDVMWLERRLATIDRTPSETRLLDPA